MIILSLLGGGIFNVSLIHLMDDEKQSQNW